MDALPALQMKLLEFTHPTDLVCDHLKVGPVQPDSKTPQLLVIVLQDAFQDRAGQEGHLFYVQVGDGAAFRPRKDLEPRF